MNSDILKGSWKVMGGRLKSTWGALTDDDLMQVQGNYERLCGKLQSKYGLNREQAGKQIDEFVGKFERDNRSAPH
ncbi:CsbD family protein [Algiphilus sp. W345]|uniref:CsbD family protein n=1 Tax=Banduia mediterranea TaxID=3075609 RepID=A0ABU2WLI0_9GAMM|nr:CsbD family protein [Algiphilus sp. W345]MDT0498743.1 CsbD family protein [Algiphilus sp. W345]